MVFEYLAVKMLNIFPTLKAGRLEEPRRGHRRMGSSKNGGRIENYGYLEVCRIVLG